VDVDDDARTIGRRLRQLRNYRRKSLRVIAGLAGISKSKLPQIERGEIALDSRYPDRTGSRRGRGGAGDAFHGSVRPGASRVRFGDRADQHSGND
jgi:DNA-binding XRE family transcriptional regulator